jgi:hypothetical protein
MMHSLRGAVFHLAASAAISWESHSRAPKAFFASSNALGLGDLLFLLGLTSCAWSPAGVRPAGAPLGCGRRRATWPAQHGARERREVSLVETTTGVHRGGGDTWGAKKGPPNLPQTHFAVEVHPNGLAQRAKGVPDSRGRWSNF